MIRGLLRFGCVAIGLAATAVADALDDDKGRRLLAALARTDPAFAKRMNRLAGLFAEEPTR